MRNNGFQIEEFLKTLPIIEEQKYAIMHEQVIINSWELQMWIEFFKDKQWKHDIKKKIIKSYNYDSLICYYIHTKFESIIDVIKQKICYEIDHNQNNYAYSKYCGMWYKTQQNNVYNYVILFEKNDTGSYYLSSEEPQYIIKTFVQKNDNVIIKRIQETIRFNNPKTLKDLCIEKISEKVSNFFDYIYDMYTETDWTFITNNLECIDLIYEQKIVSNEIEKSNFYFSAINEIFKPKIIIGEWIKFIEQFKFPKYMFNGSHIYENIVYEKNFINPNLLLFKKISKKTNDLIKTFYYDPLYYFKNGVSEIGLLRYENYLDKKYYSYVNDILKIKDFVKLKKVLESLLELDDIIIMKILFCWTSPFLSFIYGGNQSEYLEYAKKITERNIGDSLFVETIFKNKPDNIHITRFNFDQKLGILKKNKQIRTYD